MSEHELRPQPPGVPLPHPSAVSQHFWDGCAAGELRFQRCTQCRAIVFNPAIVCGTCRSHDLTWEVSTGRGTLYSWTVVWRPQTPAFEVPYAPAIVTMEEGWWFLGAVIGCDVADLRDGLPLAVEFHPAGAGFVLPYFAPA